MKSKTQIKYFQNEVAQTIYYHFSREERRHSEGMLVLRETKNCQEKLQIL